VRLVLDVELEVDKGFLRVELGDGFRRVQLCAHVAWTQSAVEEVARQAVRRVLGLHVGGTNVLEGAVGQALPVSLSGIGRLLGLVAAVATEAVFGGEDLGCGYVGDVETSGVQSQ
jgi:hypothetical protein